SSDPANPANGNLLSLAGGIVITNVGYLYLGISGHASSNQLSIVGGSAISNNGVGYSATVGGGVSNRFNTVLVSGAGSRWDTAGNVTIGSTGDGNQLIVTNGATFSAVGLLVGNGGGDSNTVLLSGPAFTWNNQNGSIYVGNSGDAANAANSNLLRLSDGV